MEAQRIAARLFALLLLFVALPVCWYYAVQMQWRVPIATQQSPVKGEWIVSAVAAEAKNVGVRPGDIVDLRGLSKRDVFIRQFNGTDKPLQYRIIRNGAERTVSLAAVHRNPFSSLGAAGYLIALLLQGTITMGVAAIVLWRRPSAVAFALGCYALGPIFTATAIALFTWLPDPVFWPVACAIDVIVGFVPFVGLFAFAMLFPEESLSPRARRWATIVTAVLISLCIGDYVWDLLSTSLFEADNVFISVVIPAVANAAVIVLVVVKYSLASGQQRRRIAWVLAGVVVSSIGYVIANVQGIGVAHMPAPVNIAAAIATAALPLSLAYAILRHRVLDIGFALNRTLVYAGVTGLVVVVISAVDWFSGRYFQSSKFSLVVEGAVAIAFGVALNWIHRRIERGVDRVLFRERHRAQTLIEARIRALDFAETSATVDSALVRDVAAIMRLASAAVFRVNEAGDFERRAACGWDDAATILQREHVLVRTLRAEEETLVLADHEIGMADFPHGAARPEIAIPIGVRHQLLGCVLYGHREGDATLDPEQRALLGRLAHAGAVAYDAIEAAHWRSRALASEGTTPAAPALLEQTVARR